MWCGSLEQTESSGIKSESPKYQSVSLFRKWKSSMGHPENQEKCGFGVWSGWGTVFIIHFEKRKARKLLSILLLHFGLILFRFDFWKT